MLVAAQKGIYMRKHFAALRPDDPAAAEVINKIPLDDVVLVEIKRPRNLAHHRKFFAMLQKVLENQEYYGSVEDLLEDFKIAIGEFDWVKRRVGEDVVEVPRGRSISFAKMDQTEFEAFYAKAIDFVVIKVIPGLSRADLERELLEFV